MGPYTGGTDSRNVPGMKKDFLVDFDSILSAGGTETTIVPDIQRVKYAKNLWNAIFGSSAALTRYSLTDIFRPPASGQIQIPSVETNETSKAHSYEKTSELPSAAPPIAFNTLPFFYDALAELKQLGSVLFPPSDVEGEPDFEQDIAMSTLTSTAKLNSRPQSTHRASMLADIENGRPMEIEVVLGECVRMARARRVDIPVRFNF